MNEEIPTLTCKRITRSLWIQLRSGSEIIIPRYTPSAWWECDLWRVTKAGFVDEYEIKTSVADFRADFRKRSEICADLKGYGWKQRTGEFEGKHELLAARHERCPNRFWFVLTPEVAERVEIPDYAGLMVPIGGNIYVDTRKPAPWLHRNKTAIDRVGIMTTFMWRFWNLEIGA